MALSFTTVEGPKRIILDKMFKVKCSFLWVEPGKCLLPPQYVFIGPRVKDLEIFEDDVWLVSFPRTGSHWVQEMIWCIGNDFNYEKAQVPLVLRNPLLESSALLVTGEYVEWFAKLGDSVSNVENTPRPRYVKTHLPWELLPTQIHQKKPKMIYITRNPKDTCVSFYHYCKTFHDLSGTFEEFAELFLDDHSPMGPFWKHVLKFWKHRDQENVLFLTYEEMTKDQRSVIKKTAKFLNKTITDEQIEGLSKHLNFSSMAANPAINLEYLLAQKKSPNQNDPDEKFLRKGKVGDWRNYMSEELSARFDAWTEKNLKDTGLFFDTGPLENEE